MSDIQRRWEQGIPHHPLSLELMEHMQRMDTRDAADLRTGGDGDNGETLMYLMDSFFEKFGAIDDEGLVKLDHGPPLMAAIRGGLLSAIHDHGPITPDMVSSAAKRVWGALKTHNRNRRKG
jgi:hypothetical protein